MNEQKLIKRLRKGKAKSYRYLFSEYYDWLCNYVFKLCNDRSLCWPMGKEEGYNHYYIA